MSQPQDSASIWAMCDSLAGSGRLWSASHASDSLPQFLWQWRVMSYRNCSSFCHEIHHHYSEPLLKDWAWPCLPRAWHVLGRASQALPLFRLRLIFWVIVMDPVSSCAVSLPKSLDTDHGNASGLGAQSADNCCMCISSCDFVHTSKMERKQQQTRQ